MQNAVTFCTPCPSYKRKLTQKEDMDYKYIEQLLERYWECQTTLEEETILRSFFAQDDIPASLLPYRDLFTAESQMAHEHLNDDFDQRLMAKIGMTNTKPCIDTQVISITQRLAPLWRAAAIVAVVLTIGMAAQQGFRHNAEETTALHVASVMGDTIQLFTEPQLSPNTEAALPAGTVDSLGISKP